MSITLKVVNSLNKEEVFEISITEKDRIMDVRKEIQKKSVYFSDMTYNRIGLFILLPKELVENQEDKKNSSKKVSRSSEGTFDLNKKYPVKMNLSSKNDLKLIDSYPYIKENSTKLVLYTYDLGFQINTPLANFIEYSSPVFILFLYAIIFNDDPNQGYNYIQIGTMAMICFHYVKRVFESLFIHIQINTMELKMFFVECLYYILYFGIYSQKKIFTEISEQKDISKWKYLFIVLFFISEMNNFHCHIILRKIRLYNYNEREIPKGNLFSLIYCANYFWEICSWLFISLFSSIKAIYFFTFMGAVIMTIWALEKKKFYHKMLYKKYGRIKENKKAIIPFII